MRIFSRSRLVRPRGAVLRLVVIVLGFLCLGVLAWLWRMPVTVQNAWLLRCLAGMAAAWAVVLVVWLVARWRAVPEREDYWLMRASGGEVEGPFTVAQIVTMWNQGQITTTGMVCQVDTERWQRLAELAPRWDASMRGRRGSLLARNGAALMLLGLLLTVFLGPVTLVLSVLGLLLWIVGRAL